MNLEKIGEKIGFIIMLLIASTILFFILEITNKLPSNWNYLYVLVLVFLIILLGALIKKILK